MGRRFTNSNSAKDFGNSFYQPTLWPVLVDTQAAALVADTKPGTIRVWEHRGKLTPRGKDQHGRTLYDVGEVAWFATRSR